ncbi:MAG: ATP-dependent RNA helicase HrpA [Gammaproteobacteria bacterium]|nr:ATP-dependent RNA helicase HrpA [Gammaproteobacteria bacterium]
MIDISQLQTQEMGLYFHLSGKLRNKKNSDKEKQKWQGQLEQLVDKSQAATQSIHETFPAIDYPQDLPIVEKVNEIQQLLLRHQVIIVAGETGCGKTTQLPKICLQAGLGARGLIGHTQPRRVAATSVSKRIADELNSNLGDFVGYSVRFNQKLSDKTRVKLITDGMLLSEIDSDPLLSKYEVLIVDEAHERSLNIDFLLGFIKNILHTRKDLKVIITSATIDLQRFSAFFNDAPILEVSGRSYPVEVRYRPIDVESDYADDSTFLDDDPLLNGIAEATQECIQHSSGDILIFTEGEAQIKSIINLLKKQLDKTCLILPLYARLNLKEQQAIFQPAGKRKIIVSTNVAETSLTVPGIVFVIDGGLARISRYSQRSKIQQLPIEKISKASAEQRKGRCGRIAPGVCIRLYSEQDYELREDFTQPEIRRTNLSSVALKLKSLHVKDVEHFPFIDVPDERAWQSAFNHLFELGAIDKQNELTSIGFQMARLPIDPQLARILVQPDLKAVDEMLVICSLMSVKEVRERPHDKQQKADQLHQVYHQNGSDILTAITLWKQLNQQKEALSANAFKQWCVKNLINFLGWLEWRKVYFQLKELVESLSIKVNSSEAHDDEIHAALIPGFITHIFCKTNERHYQGVRGLKIWIHPSSLYFKKRDLWILSAEMIETDRIYSRMNGEIKPEWIEKYASHLLKNNYQDVHWSKKKGHAVALLNQSLLGLPVVNQRRINYTAVDADLCRQLFLKEGLAKDQINENLPFLKSNREKIKSLKEQEQKFRQNNIAIDTNQLASLYENVIPEYICSLTSLKKWIKKEPIKHNQLLSFSLEQLTQTRIGDDEQFPPSIFVKGVELPLKYTFAPGSESDGVSVEIPVNMAKQFSDRDFDWLVPGYLEEKVLATLKTLPKPIRRNLIPLNETALQCCQDFLHEDKQQVLFLTALAKALTKIMGSPVNESNFDIDKVEAHLTMKYRVISGKNVSYYQSLKAVDLNDVELTDVSSEQTFESSIRLWRFKQFQIETFKEFHGQKIRIFQGLCDQKTDVSVKDFPSLQSALNSHYKGMARLILLENQSSVNQFYNTWPDKKEMERLSIRLDGFQSFYDVSILAYAISVIKKQINTNQFSQQDFDRSRDFFTKNFRQYMAGYLVDIMPLLKQRESLFSELFDLTQSAYEDSVEDMIQQLKSLWSGDVLLCAEDRIFEHYTRYHKGIQSRIKRMQTNFPKEEQALEIWFEWQEWWEDLSEESKNEEIKSELDKLLWMLEEYRISLFSPGVKTQGSISSQKLQNQFELIEGMIE